MEIDLLGGCQTRGKHLDDLFARIGHNLVQKKCKSTAINLNVDISRKLQKKKKSPIISLFYEIFDRRLRKSREGGRRVGVEQRGRMCRETRDVESCDQLATSQEKGEKRDEKEYKLHWCGSPLAR